MSKSIDQVRDQAGGKVEVKRIETDHGRELMRLKDLKPEGATGKRSTSYQRRAATASHGRFIYKHTCAYAPCGQEFDGIKTARFCSNACRQLNKRAKAATVKKG